MNLTAILWVDLLASCCTKEKERTPNISMVHTAVSINVSLYASIEVWEWFALVQPKEGIS